MHYYMPHLDDNAREAVQLTIHDLGEAATTLESMHDRLKFFAIDWPSHISSYDTSNMVGLIENTITRLEQAKYNLQQLTENLKPVDAGRKGVTPV